MSDLPDALLLARIQFAFTQLQGKAGSDVAVTREEVLFRQIRNKWRTVEVLRDAKAAGGSHELPRFTHTTMVRRWSSVG